MAAGGSGATKLEKRRAQDAFTRTPFEFNTHERWRQTRTYYAALFARDGDGRGERFRRLTKWSLISSATMVIIFIALLVI
jgi:hypothetical protein